MKTDTAREPITIALRISIEIDPTEWSEEYGVAPSQVRADVRQYVETALYDMPVRPIKVHVATRSANGTG
jgi:hypothetical protein